MKILRSLVENMLSTLLRQDTDRVSKEKKLLEHQISSLKTERLVLLKYKNGWSLEFNSLKDENDVMLVWQENVELSVMEMITVTGIVSFPNHTCFWKPVRCWYCWWIRSGTSSGGKNTRWPHPHGDKPPTGQMLHFDWFNAWRRPIWALRWRQRWIPPIVPTPSAPIPIICCTGLTWSTMRGILETCPNHGSICCLGRCGQNESLRGTTCIIRIYNE